MKCSNCSAVIRPVVAVDIDGTLAQYHAFYTKFVAAYKDIPEDQMPQQWDGMGEFRDLLGLTQHEHHQMKVAFRAGGFKRWMPKFDGAFSIMTELKSLGCEIWVTTTRPWMRMDNVDTDTVEWCRRHGIEYHHILFDEDKYGRLVELVDPERIVGVLDDEWEQIERCEELRLPVSLRSTRWNFGVTYQSMVDNLWDFGVLVEERVGVHDALQH